MHTTTTNYRVAKGICSYKCKCSICDKSLLRKITVEYTVNPFNKNKDGNVKTYQEVQIEAFQEAKRKASKLEGTLVTCRTCEEKPVNDLLLEMYNQPDTSFPIPDPFNGSPNGS